MILRRRQPSPWIICCCLVLCFCFGARAMTSVVQTRWVNPPELCVNATVELRVSNETEIVDSRGHLAFTRQALGGSSLLSGVHHRPESSSFSTEGHPTHHRKTTEEATSAFQELHRRIYAHDILMSPSMLERGISNMGDIRNLRRVLLKLITGQAIKVVIIGGSVSKGNAIKDRRNIFFHRLGSWISATFPHENHTFINHAIPAATSSYTSPCVLNLVPDDTDIVLLEFTFNDSERSYQQFDDPTRRGLERLLRKLVKLKSQPALIYLHYWAALRQASFTDTVEDSIDIVLKFYGVTSLSMRTALYMLVEEQRDLLSQIWFPWKHYDKVHPTCVGHRYMADLVIGFLQDQAHSVLLAYVNGLRSYSTSALLKEVEVQSDLRILAPVLPGNWGNLTEKCMMGESFKDLITPKWGFEWTDEGLGKWGFVAETNWSRLEIKVPTSDLVVVDRKLLLGMGFLMSYKGMGMALVECMEGCSCDKHEYSFTLPPGSRHSEPVWRTLPLFLWEGWGSCQVAVMVSDRTKSHDDPPGHKVKLLSLMMTGEMDFIDTWSYCDDCMGGTGNSGR